MFLFYSDRKCVDILRIWITAKQMIKYVVCSYILERLVINNKLKIKSKCQVTFWLYPSIIIKKWMKLTSLVNFKNVW